MRKVITHDTVSIDARRKTGDGYKPAEAAPFSAEEWRKMDAYWRASIEEVGFFPEFRKERSHGDRNRP